MLKAMPGRCRSGQVSHPGTRENAFGSVGVNPETGTKRTLFCDHLSL